jgi:hypothetical protein
MGAVLDAGREVCQRINAEKCICHQNAGQNQYCKGSYWIFQTCRNIRNISEWQ